MKNRLLKNYITTGLGILLLLGAAYVGIVQQNMERASFIGGYALLFLRSKDSLLGLAAK